MIKMVFLHIMAGFTRAAVPKKLAANRKTKALYKKGIAEYHNALSKLAELQDH